MSDVSTQSYCHSSHFDTTKADLWAVCPTARPDCTRYRTHASRTDPSHSSVPPVVTSGRARRARQWLHLDDTTRYKCYDPGKRALAKPYWSVNWEVRPRAWNIVHVVVLDGYTPQGSSSGLRKRSLFLGIIAAWMPRRRSNRQQSSPP